ncbi:MAG: EAL domain-containing protein [Gammaproteobacteria bacterium]|nr:EAL domain-containing protein [Gammaproteobacteria bacterium]
MSKKGINSAWFGMIFILLILFISGWFIYDKHFQHEFDLSSKHLKNELKFVEGLVKEGLSRHDYQLAKSAIENWGSNSPDTKSIILIASNGFEIARYDNTQPFVNEIVDESDIVYSYDGLAKLRIYKSIDSIYVNNKHFLYQLLTGYIIIAGFFVYLIYTIICIQKQKDELVDENERRIRAEEELASTNRLLYEREQNLAITLNSIGDAVIATDDKGCVVRMNPVAEKLTGWSLEEASGQPLKNIFPIINSSSRDPVDNPVEKVLSTGKVVYLSNHTTLISKDGTEYHIADSAAPIRNGDENILGMVMVFNDVTERKQFEERIRILSQAVEQSPISVMITDTEANIEYVNSAFEQVTGYSSKEVVGENARILKSGNTSKQQYQEMWQSIQSGNAWRGELQNRRKNGDIYWEFNHIAPVFDDSGSLHRYLSIREDITLRKQQEEQIIYQAHFDALTDLPNRFLSLDRLLQLINEAQRTRELVAVLFLDLDDFKKINDTLGHTIGDKLLIDTAARLRREARSGDTVGRLGGDEFIILLGGLSDASDASSIAENLLNQFGEPFNIDGRDLMLTASIGIAIYPIDGDNPHDLLRNADSAMYHSKDHGRNTYSYFTDAMNKNVSRRLVLEEQMHGALARGEFRVFYQPKTEISSRRLIGVEALLRWNNPVLGEVTPDEFIPIAEQTGLIVPIGQFVLTEALTMSAIWQKKYQQLFTVAVNLSPRQFRDPNLTRVIEQMLNASGVNNELLELEITEGVLMSGHSHIDSALATLNTLGVSIAMDDFGTGYSSLSYLRKYPFDVLKIDRSFIADITKDKADRELVYAAIAMAHGLGLKVVAEGVETEEQLMLLAAQGCEIAQGNLFSKPVSADRITEMLEAK